MKLSPQLCLGLANHPSGQLKTTESFKQSGLTFNHCCFEQRMKTTFPFFDKLIVRILEHKTKQENQNQTQEIS